MSFHQLTSHQFAQYIMDKKPVSIERGNEQGNRILKECHSELAEESKNPAGNRRREAKPSFKVRDFRSFGKLRMTSSEV